MDSSTQRRYSIHRRPSSHLVLPEIYPLTQDIHLDWLRSLRNSSAVRCLYHLSPRSDLHARRRLRLRSPPRQYPRTDHSQHLVRQTSRSSIWHCVCRRRPLRSRLHIHRDRTSPPLYLPNHHAGLHSHDLRSHGHPNHLHLRAHRSIAHPFNPEANYEKDTHNPTTTATPNHPPPPHPNPLKHDNPPPPIPPFLPPQRHNPPKPIAPPPTTSPSPPPSPTPPPGPPNPPQNATTNAQSSTSSPSSTSSKL